MVNQRFFLSAGIALVFGAFTSTNAQNLRGLEQVTSPSDFHVDMLNAVNSIRAQNGLPPMCYNQKLMQAAQAHSDYQATSNLMSHTGVGGSNPTQRGEAVGFYGGLAENVAAGQTDVESVMSSWIHSPGHYANLMSDNKFFGMGYAYNPEGVYHSFWTQTFGNAEGESCVDLSPVDQQTVPEPTTEPPPSAPTQQQW